MSDVRRPVRFCRPPPELLGQRGKNWSLQPVPPRRHQFTKLTLYWLSYRGIRLEQVDGYAPSSQHWQRRILLLNHTCKNFGVLGETLTRNLRVRTARLW